MVLTALFVLAPANAEAQFIETRSLGLDGARQVLAGADAEARANGWNVAISIVDPAGLPIVFQRMDGVGPIPEEIAVRKARSAARFGAPTSQLEAMAEAMPAFLTVGDLMPLEGGIPIIVDGIVVGAIGVSGVTAAQDAQIAQAGIDALLN